MQIVKKINIRPRFSLNKLAEYEEANASRRRTITYNQKYPSPVIVARYRAVYTTLKNFMAFNYENEDFIIDAIESLAIKNTSTTWQEDDKNNSIKALNKFRGIETPELNGFSITPYKGIERFVEIEGVKISINPDLIIRGAVRGKEKVGAIKFHVSTSNSLTEIGQKYVSTLLQTFLNEHCLNTNETVSFKHCISIDVFAQRVGVAPKSHKRLMKNIISACEEIGLRWDSL